MRNFDSEIASIRSIGTVIASATALVVGIADRVEAAVKAFQDANPDADTSELDATIAAARAQADDLAAAVSANTSQATSDGGVIQPGTGEGLSSQTQPAPEGASSGGAEAQTE